MNQLKVKSTSNLRSVAGAIAGKIKDGEDKLEIITVGAGSLNQAIKAIIIARGFLAQANIDIGIVPSFSDVTIDDNTVTAISCNVVRL